MQIQTIASFSGKIKVPGTVHNAFLINTSIAIQMKSLSLKITKSLYGILTVYGNMERVIVNSLEQNSHN